jgi:hypothetical protein
MVLDLQCYISKTPIRLVDYLQVIVLDNERSNHILSWSKSKEERRFKENFGVVFENFVKKTLF